MKIKTPAALEVEQVSGLQSMTLHLFTNDLSLADDGSFTSTDFDEASTAHGYAAAELDSTDWVVSSTGLTTGGYPIAKATQARVDFEFTHTTQIDVYGWYTLSTGGDAMWAEKLAPAASLLSGAGTISINPIDNHLADR